MGELHISDRFDGGNICVLEAKTAHSICLAIRKDSHSDFFQWFYFRLSGAKDKVCHLSIENAAQAAYAQGWKGYQACASYDRQSWFRVQTRYENEKLVITHRPAFESIYFAYFAPYSLERHGDLIAECLCHEGVGLEVLGHSIEGRDMDCLSVGEGAKNIWVIARQHPGETMAQWWIEGFLERLLDESDSLATCLRRKARFFIVPNMNPDGSYKGHLRTNAAGVNLNRVWNIADVQTSPEVYHVLQAMQSHPPALCLDVHGDETLPYNFIAGTQGVTGYSQKQAQNLTDFITAYEQASPDFQTQHGYPVNPPDSANLSMCGNYTAKQFQCLSMTLEMPFKDNADLPCQQFGWSSDRAMALGAAVLHPLWRVMNQL